MAIPSNPAGADSPAGPGRPSALNAAQAVALALLKHGYTQPTIQARTGVGPGDLYRLAVAHGVNAPCGTTEQADVHDARGEDLCGPCATARGRADAPRALARQRKRIPAADLQERLAAPRRRRAAAQ